MRTRRATVSSIHLGQQLADEGVGFLRLGGGGVLAGADGPDRLVGDDRFLHLRRRQPGQAAAHLAVSTARSGRLRVPQGFARRRRWA